jgi:hypothetical protein
MATTTPNYGWTVPTSTDLVKDGATAIETLGDAIDASMNTALGTKKAGMVLLNTTSFSAVSSQAVTAFSSTYDNYKVIVNITSTSTDMNLELRFGNSGTANTDSNHQWAYWLRNNAGGNLSFDGSNSNVIFLGSMETYSGTGSRFTNTAFDVYNPFLVSETGGNVQISTVNTSGAPTFGAGGFIKGGSTSWSQFFLLASTGNMTGTVKTYGYNA